MESPEFFAPLPLSMDSQTKAVSSTSSSTDMAAELQKLNATHRALQTLDSPNLFPPPPNAINQKRTQQVIKMRETAQNALAKSQTGTVGKDGEPTSEAVKLYSLALDMAKQRPEWEAAGLRREELAALYRGRAEAYLGIRAYTDGLVDAQMSLECKNKANAVGVSSGLRQGVCRTTNKHLQGALAKASRCLMEMRRSDEAAALIAPLISEEISGLEQAKGQIGQIPAGHPQLGQAKAQIAAFEKDIEELKGIARELDVKF